jgi:glycosyltransferase involved in cell wall biosynthesis
MKFILKELLKSLVPKRQRKRVGFIVPHISLYHRVTASTRIRVYDVIEAFRNDVHFQMEIYRPFRKYDIVVFLKTYDGEAFQLAEKLKEGGTRVVFDININVFESGSRFVTTIQRQQAMDFAHLCDAVITNSIHTENVLRRLFPEKKVQLIHEAIHTSYFGIKRELPKQFTMLWMGYSHKAEALLLIKEVLLELYKTYSFKLLLVSEKDSHLDFGEIPVEFRPYRHHKVSTHLSEANVFLAPRDLNDPYNLGHSFTKVGIALAAQIPVVASPVPSYLEAPILLCKSNDEWFVTLKELLDNKTDLEALGLSGKEFCFRYFCMDEVRNVYSTFFSHLTQ